MINRIILAGRLTRDPELRRTANDKAVVSFTIAVDDRFKDESGQKTTTFMPVTLWGLGAENVSKFCRKGSLVGVDGRIRQRTYEKKDGTKVSVYEVIADNVSFLEPKGSRPIENEEVVLDNSYSKENKNLESIDIAEDDLPF